MNIFNYSLYMYMLLVLEVNLKFFLIVECVLGIYYDVIIEICLMCFCGFYQLLSGQDYCNLCFVGMMIKVYGVQDLLYCECEY